MKTAKQVQFYSYSCRNRMTAAVIMILAMGFTMPQLRAMGAEPPTYHPDAQILEISAPGRMALLNNGDLGCISKGRYLTSSDDGLNWNVIGEIEPDENAPAAHGGMLVETKTGTLILIYRDDEGGHLERDDDNRPLPGAKLDIWSVRSTDGGKTWNDYRQVIDGYCGAMIDLICTDSNIVVLPLLDLRYNPPRGVTVVNVSDDDGLSWRAADDLDIGGHGIEDGALEPTIVERVDGSLLMFMRTTRDRIWYAISEDRGFTWTLACPTDIPASNSPSFLLGLDSGRIALVWNPLHPVDQKGWPRLALDSDEKEMWPRRTKPRYAERPDNVYRETLLLAFSEDGGESWTDPVVIARQPGGKMSYAYMIERRPGEIWVAIRGKWLKILEDDFTDPK